MITTKKSRRPLIYALIVIFLWFGTSGVLGPLFGKLSTVQENNNSAFLPDSAESTQTAKIIEVFNVSRNQILPTLVIYLGKVSAEKIAGLNAHLATLGVVGFILIIVSRSPFLWILPLFSAVIALATAGGLVYLLTKNNVIDLNGQSQGILSVLVLGAATDYALLLISRYREELHHFDRAADAIARRDSALRRHSALAIDVR